MTGPLALLVLLAVGAELFRWVGRRTLPPLPRGQTVVVNAGNPTIPGDVENLYIMGGTVELGDRERTIANLTDCTWGDRNPPAPKDRRPEPTPPPPATDGSQEIVVDMGGRDKWVGRGFPVDFQLNTPMDDRCEATVKYVLTEPIEPQPPAPDAGA